MLRLKKAYASYGYNVYPITNLPEVFDEKKVTDTLRERFHGDPRAENITTSFLPSIGVVPATAQVHFEDWSVNAIYMEEHSE